MTSVGRDAAWSEAGPRSDTKRPLTKMDVRDGVCVSGPVTASVAGTRERDNE